MYKDKKVFDLYTCTEEELKIKCNSLKFNQDKTQFCIDAFLLKLSEKSLVEKYCIELQSVKNKKLRYKKLILNK